MSAKRTTAAAIDRGREAFAEHAWAEAHAALAAAERDATLDPDDLERLAIAARLLGRYDESTETTIRAHRAWLDHGDVERAARCAFWVAFGLLEQGEQARAGGWLARAERLLDDGGCDCVERGYLLLPRGLERMATGDAAGARAAFAEAVAIGRRFDDPDLTALARQGEGRALIRGGEVTGGVALLDEVMVAVTSGDGSPIVVGTVYCSVIGACHEIFDLGRAREWTEALHAWCAAQPDLVPFRGQCLTWRAEILQRQGAWEQAIGEAQAARERLAQPPHPALGAACYRLAELHRLRGEFGGAEAAYEEASRHGRAAQPGLALLRLAQGRADAAQAAVRRARDDVNDLRTRATLLPAVVEILLAVDDVAGARAAADELASLAAALGASVLRAEAAHADGAVALAEGDARGAAAALRNAAAVWRQLDAPYDAARARMLLGLACRVLGDDDTARLELSAARQIFTQLGARPDADRAAALVGPAREARPGGLTAREVQVLRLVAAGKTNRAVADALSISEKTVARHVSNIFTKLGLSSRAAATAYAYEHGLIRQPT